MLADALLSDDGMHRSAMDDDAKYCAWQAVRSIDVGKRDTQAAFRRDTSAGDAAYGVAS